MTAGQELRAELTWTDQTTAVIALVGDLDFTTVSGLAGTEQALQDRRVTRLMIDTSGVPAPLADRLERFGLSTLFEVDSGPGLVTA